MKLKKIISNLSLKEKVSLLSGFDNWYTPELKKYGIPNKVINCSYPRTVNYQNTSINKIKLELIKI